MGLERIKEILTKFAKFVRQKKKTTYFITLFFIVVFAFIVSVVPTKNSINGHYYYKNNGIIEEEVILHINNTVEYYFYDPATGAKAIGYNGMVTRWRVTLNNKDYKEAKGKGLIASPYQVQFCNNNWGSHFQLFKVEDTVLYSKSLNSENMQKCYIKK